MLQSGELVELVDAGVRRHLQPHHLPAGHHDQPGLRRRKRKRSPPAARTPRPFRELAVADIQAAADILLPVYEARNRSDGFVSINLAPDLAYDVQTAIAEAHRLLAAVDRPNVMIKVPATKPGIGQSIA